MVLTANNYWKSYYKSEALERSKELFAELDIDESGEIDKEEFIQGCLRALQHNPNSIRVEHEHSEDKPKDTFIGSETYF